MLKFLRFIAIITLLMFSAINFGQSFVYKIGYFGFFDNREYFNKYINDQTIFGSRISGELGYSFDERNKIMAGIDYLYEFGSKGELIAPDIVAYYEARYKNIGFNIGSFPRVNKVQMPLAVFSDTVQYYRPTIEGIFLEYKTKSFHHNIWIDWVGRQSFKKQEMFLLGFSGYLNKGVLFYQHHFIMTHLAHSMNDTIEEHIRDNAGFAVLPGLNLTKPLNLDTFTISAGILASYDRLRGIYDFNFPIGFYGEINALYRHFGIKETIYAGENQIITSGDGFYKSDFYCRTDAYYSLSNSNIEGKLQLSFHFLPHVMDLSMSLVVRAHLDGLFKRQKFN